MRPDDNVKILFKGGEGGHLNIGDQAMLLNTIDNIKRIFRSVDIFVLVENPAGLSDALRGTAFESPHNYFAKQGVFSRSLVKVVRLKFLFELMYFLKCLFFLFAGLVFHKTGTSIIRDKSIKNIFLRLKEADFLYIGGGGYLNDIWPEMLYQTAALVRLAKIFKKKIVITGQGLGPVKAFFYRIIAGNIFSKVDILTFRDFKNSAEFVASLGGSASIMRSVGDDAMSLKIPSEFNVFEIFKSENINCDGLIFGVNFRIADYNKIINSQIKVFANFLDSIAHRYDGSILFIPLSYHSKIDDRNAEFELYKNMKERNRAHFILNEYNAREIKGIVGAVDIMMGISYHSLVFALSQGVPSIGFYNNEYYRLKLEGLFDFYALRKFVFELGNSFDSKGVFDSVENIIHNKGKYKSDILMKQDKINFELENVLRSIAGIA